MEKTTERLRRNGHRRHSFFEHRAAVAFEPLRQRAVEGARVPLVYLRDEPAGKL